MVFDYYGLTQPERVVVRDGVRAVIPSMQPRRNKITPLMRDTDSKTRSEYGSTLVAALNEWMRPSLTVSARLIEGDSGVAVVELELGSSGKGVRVDRQQHELEDALRRIMKELPAMVSRNVELHPDLKVFIDDKLYLTKPLSTRYWLTSTALNDADEIAADLLSADAQARRRAGNERYR
jgi:hypothetical protein